MYLASSSTSNGKVYVVQGKCLQYWLGNVSSVLFHMVHFNSYICIISRIKLNNLLCCLKYFRSIWLIALWLQKDTIHTLHCTNKRKVWKRISPCKVYGMCWLVCQLFRLLISQQGRGATCAMLTDIHMPEYRIIYVKGGIKIFLSGILEHMM